MRDKVIAGSLAGIIGSFVMAVLAIILNITGISTIRILYLNSIVFLPSQLADTIAGNIFGLFTHLLIGAIVGIIIVYLLPYIGTDYLLFKGMLLGAFSWLIIGGMIGNMLRLPMQDTILNNTLLIFLNLIFGIVTFYLAILISRK
jgi:hypothetical protein